MMIGMAAVSLSARRRRQTSTPEMLGMTTSSRMRSGRSATARVMACSPSDAVNSSKPSRPRPSRSISRIRFESSTQRILFLSIAHLTHRSLHRKTAEVPWEVGCGKGAHRHGEVVALKEIDPQVEEAAQVRFALDSFGDDPGPELRRQLRDRLDHHAAVTVVARAGNEEAVDFEVLGACLDHHPVVGKADADVVEGDAHAEVAKAGD